MANLPDIHVLRKIVPSEYQRYAPHAHFLGRRRENFSKVLISAKSACFWMGTDGV